MQDAACVPDGRRKLSRDVVCVAEVCQGLDVEVVVLKVVDTRDALPGGTIIGVINHIGRGAGASDERTVGATEQEVFAEGQKDRAAGIVPPELQDGGIPLGIVAAGAQRSSNADAVTKAAAPAPGGTPVVGVQKLDEVEVTIAVHRGSEVDIITVVGGYSGADAEEHRRLARLR